MTMQKITAFLRLRSPDPSVTYGKVFMVRWEYDKTIPNAGPIARDNVVSHVAAELGIERSSVEWITSFLEWPQIVRT